MKNIKSLGKFLSIVFLSLVLTECMCFHPRNGNEVDLTPNDKRPVYRIFVEDGSEVAILKQQLKIEPIYVRGKTLYFLESEEVIKKLEELGYRPVKENPYEVYERVVRVIRKGKEEELLKTGVKLINREKKYWIARGNLEQLKILKRLGYRISKITPMEPRPREVCIYVTQPKDIAWVGSIHIDIYNVQRTESGFLIYGGAFDYQIDQVRDNNFKVEIISTIKKGGKNEN